MLKRTFNRLIAKTSIYKSLFALYESEISKSAYFKKNFKEVSGTLDKTEVKMSRMKRASRNIMGYVDRLEEALDIALSDKERAIGSSVALSDEVAHLRKCLDSTEYLQKYIAEHTDKLDRVAGSPGWAVKMLAKSFAESMGNAPSFITTVISHPDHGDFEYMVRRRDGQTVGEWAYEVIGHLKDVLEQAEAHMGDGVAEFKAAREWISTSENFTHDFTTRLQAAEAADQA